MYKIAIDSGHGGSDPGAVGVNKIQEKKINSNVGDMLILMLRQAGYEVLDVRNGDEEISLSERARRMNAFKPDLWLSDHHNASADHRGNGFQIIYSVDPKWSAKSKLFALDLEEQFKKLNNKHSVYFRRGNKNPADDYYTVMALTEAPGCIVELCFIDNPNDVTVVNSLLGQWAEAQALFLAIHTNLSRR